MASWKASCCGVATSRLRASYSPRIEARDTKEERACVGANGELTQRINVATLSHPACSRLPRRGNIFRTVFSPLRGQKVADSLFLFLHDPRFYPQTLSPISYLTLDAPFHSFSRRRTRSEDACPRALFLFIARPRFSFFEASHAKALW